MDNKLQFVVGFAFDKLSLSSEEDIYFLENLCSEATKIMMIA